MAWVNTEVSSRWTLSRVSREAQVTNLTFAGTSSFAPQLSQERLTTLMGQPAETAAVR
jgi:hypothetical protein